MTDPHAPETAPTIKALTFDLDGPINAAHAATQALQDLAEEPIGEREQGAVYELVAIIMGEINTLRAQFKAIAEATHAQGAGPPAPASAAATPPAPETKARGPACEGSAAAASTPSIRSLLKEYLITYEQGADEDSGAATDRNYALWTMLEQATPTTPADCADLLRFARQVITRMEGDGAGIIDEPWIRDLHPMLGRVQTRVAQLREPARVGREAAE